MTHILTVISYITLIIAFLYLLGTAGFWTFCMMFGKIDQIMQDRYWKNRGFLRTMSKDGKEFYVGWTNDNQ